VAYLEETLSPKSENGVSSTPLTHSPVSSKKENVNTFLPHRADFPRRLIPSIHEHFDLHQALMKLWIQKKIIEDDMNEIRGQDEQGHHHVLAQQLDTINQTMYALIEESPAFQDQESPGNMSLIPVSTSSHQHHPVQMVSQDLTPMIIIWFLYEEEETTAVVPRHMRVAELVDKAVDIVSSRGQSVSHDQVELRYEGEVLLPVRILSDYSIEPEDIIEILVVSEVQTISKESSKFEPIGILHPDDIEFESKRHDIFARPAGDKDVIRDIFQSSGERFLAPSRDIFAVPAQSSVRPAIQGSPPPGHTTRSASSAMGDRSTTGVSLSATRPASRPRVSPKPSTQPRRPRSPGQLSLPGKPDTYYGVRKGWQVGICDSWDEVVRRIKSYPYPEYCAFSNWEDAKAYVLGGMWRDMPDSARPYVTSAPASGDLQGQQGIGDTNRGSVVDRTSKSQDKIKQTFKCPRFFGNAKDWKTWNKGFTRYLSIWDLEHVLDPGFFDAFPLSTQHVIDNKLVYFILEDATQSSPLASSYIRQAPIKNGFEAYYTLHDGYVFAAATSSTILLNEIANFRFKEDETPTELIMRLEELLQDLEMLPGGASMTFNDTQAIGYLLGALRHEPEWATVASAITSSQLKGEITFRQACDELRFRCEADRAYSIIDKNVKSKRRVPAMDAKIEAIEIDSSNVETKTALVSSTAKRLNKDDGSTKKESRRKYDCLARDCDTKTAFPLCGFHYHTVVSGKSPTLELTGGIGTAAYNVTTKMIDYPQGVPKDRMPAPKDIKKQ
jgi:hypothetical protein